MVTEFEDAIAVFATISVNCRETRKRCEKEKQNESKVCREVWIEKIERAIRTMTPRIEHSIQRR